MALNKQHPSNEIISRSSKEKDATTVEVVKYSNEPVCSTSSTTTVVLAAAAAAANAATDDSSRRAAEPLLLQIFLTTSGLFPPLPCCSRRRRRTCVLPSCKQTMLYLPFIFFPSLRLIALSVAFVNSFINVGKYIHIMSNVQAALHYAIEQTTNGKQNHDQNSYFNNRNTWKDNSTWVFGAQQDAKRNVFFMVQLSLCIVWLIVIVFALSLSRQRFLELYLKDGGTSPSSRQHFVENVAGHHHHHRAEDRSGKEEVVRKVKAEEVHTKKSNSRSSSSMRAIQERKIIVSLVCAFLLFLASLFTTIFFGAELPIQYSLVVVVVATQLVPTFVALTMRSSFLVHLRHEHQTTMKYLANTKNVDDMTAALLDARQEFRSAFVVCVEKPLAFNFILGGLSVLMLAVSMVMCTNSLKSFQILFLLVFFLITSPLSNLPVSEQI